MCTEQSWRLLEQEFDLLMKINDINVPDRLKYGAIKGFSGLKQMTILLRQPRTAESEPSNIYSLKAILASISQ